MIAAWLSIAVGWALAHPVLLLVFGVLAVLLAICCAIYLLATSESGRHHASRAAAGPPRRPGKARAWLRAAPRAARSLPGAITWTWSTPVRTKLSKPLGVPWEAGVDAGAYQEPPLSRPGQRVTSRDGGGQGDLAATPELHHEPGLGREDRATIAWLRTLRGPGWTILAVRRQLAVLGALIASGRVTPGLHTAGSPGSEPGHPAGTSNDGQGTGKSGIAQRATGSLSGDESASAQQPPAAITYLPAPQMLTLTEGRDVPLAVRMNTPGFLGRSGPMTDPEATDWTLLADLAPWLEAERLDAQAQTQAGA